MLFGHAKFSGDAEGQYRMSTTQCKHEPGGSTFSLQSQTSLVAQKRLEAGAVNHRQAPALGGRITGENTIAALVTKARVQVVIRVCLHLTLLRVRTLSWFAPRRPWLLRRFA